MATLRDALVYLCKNYPRKSDLSKTKVTKLVYLADWLSAIRRGQQLTPIVWQFNHYGPYVEDVIDVARTDHAFEIVKEMNYFGSPKELVVVRADADHPSVSEDDRKILDHVIQSTAQKKWSDFIRLVYSTYPIVSQPRYSELDLVKLAHEYRAVQDLLV